MDDEKSLRLELLGRWNISDRGQTIRVGLRQERLLAALAVHGIRSRPFLCSLLWPECTESHAQGSLRAAVFTLSRRLPGAVLCHGVDLALNERVEVDLHRLRQMLDGTGPLVRSREESRWLLDHSRVELLPGWSDDWVVSEADRLMEDYVGFLESHAHAAFAKGDLHQALLLARVARRIDPLRESAVLLLIQSHLALGNKTTALREFRDHCAVVAQELGSEPSPHLVAMFKGLHHA